MDAAELIAMGITGRRSTVPLTTEDAVCLALSGEPSAPLGSPNER